MKVCPVTGLYLDPITGRGIDATTSQVIGKKKWRKTLELAKKNKEQAVRYCIYIFMYILHMHDIYIYKEKHTNNIQRVKQKQEQR